jgi:hypothetical protein
MMLEEKMKCNVGGVDMVVRLVAGAILLVVALAVPMGPVWQTVVLVLATIGLVTGAIRFCPLNALLGINSCGDKQAPGQSDA